MAGLRNRKHARIGISLVCHETICWFEFSLSLGVSEDWESPAEPSLHPHPIRLMLMVWWLGAQRQRALEHALACRFPGFTDLPSPVWLQWELLITFVCAFRSPCFTWREQLPLSGKRALNLHVMKSSTKAHWNSTLGSRVSPLETDLHSKKKLTEGIFLFSKNMYRQLTWRFLLYPVQLIHGYPHHDVMGYWLVSLLWSTPFFFQVWYKLLGTWRSTRKGHVMGLFESNV